MRKHFTAMTQEEIKALIAKVRSCCLSFHSHAKDRMREKRISESEVFAAISYGSIVEAHNNTPGELRVVVRGKVRGDFICPIISLTKSEIVTVYRNKAGDHHSTLDKTQYTWKQNLMEII